MAIWQFQFSLIPVDGIVKHFGEIVPNLSEYQRRLADAPVKDLADFCDYWEGVNRPKELMSALAELLPKRESWSDDALMFGAESSDQIEIWPDDIDCAIDVRTLNWGLVNSIISIAAKLNCKIVLKDDGRVIDPDISAVADAIRDSVAWQFLQAPIEYILTRETLGNE